MLLFAPGEPRKYLLVYPGGPQFSNWVFHIPGSLDVELCTIQICRKRTVLHGVKMCKGAYGSEEAGLQELYPRVLLDIRQSNQQ